ncbi:MAG: RagB/SusD family nutrient uptake outer membrane protein, partial [Schleiferiaceae bacterium]
VGQQYDDAGNALTDRQGNPLSFTASLPGITGATETDGIRVLKWAVDNAAAGGDAQNDLAVVRYADVLLMKAECLLAEGDETGALAIVNDIRARAGATARTSLSMDDLLEERGFELAWEAVRRMDLIRHGKFTDAWELKEVTGEDYVKLMPIPFSALGANPNLEQNPGYPAE